MALEKEGGLSSDPSFSMKNLTISSSVVPKSRADYLSLERSQASYPKTSSLSLKRDHEVI